jgi:hypothetical protein
MCRLGIHVGAWLEQLCSVSEKGRRGTGLHVLEKASVVVSSLSLQEDGVGGQGLLVGRVLGCIWRDVPSLRYLQVTLAKDTPASSLTSSQLAAALGLDPAQIQGMSLTIISGQTVRARVSLGLRRRPSSVDLSLRTKPP